MVQPPEVGRYFVQVKSEVLQYFVHQPRLYGIPLRHVEDEFVSQNCYKLNQAYYASLGEKKAFVLSQGRNLMILKIVGYAEEAALYYNLLDFKAHIWIAHQRYPTRGRVWHPGGAHPFAAMNVALVHNGDFANYFAVSEYLNQRHLFPQFLTDTEVAVLLYDLWIRLYGYPLEYVIQAMAPTTERDFDLLPAKKQRIYRPAKRGALRRRGLRRSSRGAAPERDLRPRAGRLHGRDSAQARAFRGGERRHDLLGRGGGHQPRHPGQAAAVLESGRFRRLGGTQEIAVDVRIVAATNRDLRQAISRGHFREDLFYRLATFTVEIPPLRERREDVRLLADHFTERFNARFSLSKRFSEEAMDAMVRHAWPGNVRELLHVVEQSVVLCDGEVIGLADLPASIRGAAPAAEDPGPADMLTLREVQRRHINRPD